MEIKKSQAVRAAQAVSGTEDGKIFLGYLVAKYGFAGCSTFHENPVKMNMNEGARSVMVEIGRMLATDANELEDIERRNQR